MMLLLLICLQLTTSVVLCADAHINGTWLPVQSWPFVAIHMVLTKSGSVLSYGPADPGVQRNPDMKFWYDVWDPSSNTHNTLTTDIGGNYGANLFCSGQVMDPTTGKVLITGGSQVINGTRNYGTPHVQFFDPDTETLQITEQNMRFPRWYPTLTTLANSRIIVQGGRFENTPNTPHKGITTPEIYTPRTGSWRMLTGANNTIYQRANAWWYPKTFAAKGGGAIVFFNSMNEVWKFNQRNGGSLDLVATVPGQSFSSSAPATYIDRHKILIVQGNQDVSIVDISNPNRPVSQPTGSLREQRFWANSVALPSGEVLVVGGASILQQLDHAVNYAEIWNPATGEWRIGATAERARLYHSTALLLPDATVLVGGGGSPGPVTNENAEIYLPPYLFNANGERATRPVITALSRDPGYGRTIQVYLQDATKIMRVSLHRLGSVTHSFDMDARMIPLPFKRHSNALSISVICTFGKSLAPPGWYMMFVVDDEGVPSVGKIFKLG